MIDGKWQTVYTKQTKTPREATIVHKLASTDATYSFCVRNLDRINLQTKVNIKSGMELMEFQVLP